MYQAIVFLPLLGAILAGLISLYGAMRRFPGAEPSDDHHAGHGHAHAAHDDHAHGHDDHGHGPVEPAAEGSRGAEIITTAFLFIACVLSWVALWQVCLLYTSDAADE